MVLKKIVLVCAAVTISIATGLAQDKIITRDGDIIKAYNVDVGGSSVYYRLEDNGSAPLQSIPKDKLLMIKKVDGQVINLYESNEATVSSNRSQQIVAESNKSEETISAKANESNERMIAAYNSYNPKYVGGNIDKEAGRVLCVLGISSESQIVNDDIEIYTTAGHMQGNNFEKVKYYFQNPAIRLSVKNKTNRTIFVDLGNTFFVRHGIAQAYYVPSSTSTGKSTSSGVGVNLGAVAGALGVGGAVGTLADGINVGSGSGSTTVTTTYSQRVIAVPPMSMINLSPAVLFSGRGKYCNGLFIDFSKGMIKPYFSFKNNESSLKRGEVLNYKEAFSPVSFSAYVSYSFTEDCAQEKKASVSYYLKQIIGFPGSKMNDSSYSCNSLLKSIQGFQDSIYFIGNIAKGIDVKLMDLEDSFFPLQ